MVELVPDTPAKHHIPSRYECFARLTSEAIRRLVEATLRAAGCVSLNACWRLTRVVAGAGQYR